MPSGQGTPSVSEASDDTFGVTFVRKTKKKFCFSKKIKYLNHFKVEFLKTLDLIFTNKVYYIKKTIKVLLSSFFYLTTIYSCFKFSFLFLPLFLPLILPLT